MNLYNLGPVEFFLRGPDFLSMALPVWKSKISSIASKRITRESRVEQAHHVFFPQELQ